MRPEDCSTLWDPQQKILDGRCGQSVTWDHLSVFCSADRRRCRDTIVLTGMAWFNRQFGARPFRHRWTVTISLNATRSGTSSQCKSSCSSCERPQSNFLVLLTTRAAAFNTRCSCRSSSFSQLQGLSCSNRHASRRVHAHVLSLTACQVTSGFVASGEDDRSNWHWCYWHAGRGWGQTQCRHRAGGHGQRQRQYFLQAAVLVGWCLARTEYVLSRPALSRLLSVFCK